MDANTDINGNNHMLILITLNIIQLHNESGDEKYHNGKATFTHIRLHSNIEYSSALGNAHSSAASAYEVALSLIRIDGIPKVA
jgi:hypothetical protein